MSTLESIVESIKALGLKSPPKRIVVDPHMMRRIEAEVPVGRGKIGSFSGIPIVVDRVLGEDRGFIEYSDGRIEKFGKWPKPPSPQFERFERDTIAREPGPPSVNTVKGIAFVFFLCAHGPDFNVVHVAWDSVQGIAHVKLEVDALPKHEMTAIAEAMAGMLPTWVSTQIEMITERSS